MTEPGAALVPRPVLDAWELDGDVEQLTGGEGTSVRVGALVLKPRADETFVVWYAQLCDRLAASSFRLPAPVPTRDGSLVFDGWSATTYVVGCPVQDDDGTTSSWLSVLAASRDFHAAVAGQRCPALLDARTYRWAHADRAAWNEADLDDVGPRSYALLSQMRVLTHDEGLSAQLVHGDLSGNVLLADGYPPAVIDVSPYWRPAAYADAVVVIDALLWWQADLALVDLGCPEGLSSAQWRSLLARALVFRLLAFDERRRDADEVDDELPRYARVLEVLACWAPTR